jgi:hypothetical protein
VLLLPAAALCGVHGARTAAVAGRPPERNGAHAGNNQVKGGKLSHRLLAGPAAKLEGKGHSLPALGCCGESWVGLRLLSGPVRESRHRVARCLQATFTECFGVDRVGAPRCTAGHSLLSVVCLLHERVDLVAGGGNNGVRACVCWRLVPARDGG